MFVYNNLFFLTFGQFIGGLAQLARALDWQSKGQGFDSPNLHQHTMQINAKSCKLNIYRIFCFSLLCRKVPFNAIPW